MTSSGSLQPLGPRSLATAAGPALDALPARQGQWVVGSVAAALLTVLSGIWAAQPEVALVLAIAAGAAVVNPRKLWAAPVVATGVTLVGLGAFALGIPAVIGAGAAAGALATWMVPHRTDWLDLLNGGLAGLAGCSLGLWAASAILPAALPAAASAALTAGIVALVGSQGLLPAALRFDREPEPPTIREINKTLRVTYRPPVFRALELFRTSRGQAPDAETRRGLAEVATWVFRLQETRQALDTELAQIDPESVRSRILRNRAASKEADEFTRERRQATADHLERLLEHRKAIGLEADRNEALVDYALAFLEEARAGLAVARKLPGETLPDRLPEVLDRLRNQAREGDARRRTARELSSLEG